MINLDYAYFPFYKHISVIHFYQQLSEIEQFLRNKCYTLLLHQCIQSQTRSRFTVFGWQENTISKNNRNNICFDKSHENATLMGDKKKCQYYYRRVLRSMLSLDKPAMKLLVRK